MNGRIINLAHRHPRGESPASRVALIFLALFTLLAPAGWAIPHEVAVTGYLTEQTTTSVAITTGTLVKTVTTPVTGDFPLRMTFKDTPTTTTVVVVVTTTAQVREGVLNAIIQLPEELFVREEVWYLVDLDRDNNGFDAGDRFGQAVRLTSVPYALSAQPLKYFESHGGQGGFKQFGAQFGTNQQGRIVLAPFSTPPGGVEFNRMASSFGFDQTADTSFGIYDANGNLVYSSPKINGAQINDLLSFEIVGKLQPSSIYYTALITTAAQTPSLGIIMLPNIPTRGYYMSTSLDGTLPAKIDLNQVQFSSNYRPISVSFYTVADTAPAAQKLSLGKGISYAPGKDGVYAPK